MHDLVFTHSTTILVCSSPIMGIHIYTSCQLRTYFHLSANNPVKTGVFGPKLKKHSDNLGGSGEVLRNAFSLVFVT